MSTLLWNRLVGALVYDCKLQGNDTALTVACLVNDLAIGLCPPQSWCPPKHL